MDSYAKRAGGSVGNRHVPGPASRVSAGRRQIRSSTQGTFHPRPTASVISVTDLTHSPPIAKSYASAVTASSTLTSLRLPALSTGISNGLETNSSPPNFRTGCKNESENAFCTTKTTCLLCSHNISINDSSVRELKTSEKNKMFRNLCHHAQMNKKEIPEVCTQEMFPLCIMCENQVKRLWEIQKVMQEAQQNISNILHEIERTVADAQILNRRGMERTSAEQRRFTKLRELILCGYRNKLIMKQKLRENLSDVSVNLTFSHTSVMRDALIKGQYSAFEAPDSFETNQENESREHVQKQDDNLVEVESINNMFETTNCQSVPEYSTPNNVEEEELNVDLENENEESMEIDPWADDDNNIVAKYNERNCTLVITEVKTKTGCAPEVKQEIMPPASKSEGADATPAKRKRRLLYEGVEIFRVAGSRPNSVYLQCSICNMCVPIAKYCAEAKSPFQNMKTHIRNAHRKKKAAYPAVDKKKVRRTFKNARTLGVSTSKTVGTPTSAVLATTKDFACKTCEESFQDKAALREHRKSHPSPYYYVIECDICGRPVKGTKNNLYIHKFSHKNDEERRAAVTAGERGARKSMLQAGTSLRLKEMSKQNKMKKLKKLKRLPSVQPKNLSNGRDIKCRLCSREFSRNCYLALHMKSHLRGADIADGSFQSSSSTLNNNESALGEVEAENEYAMNDERYTSESLNLCGSLTLAPGTENLSTDHI